MKRGQQCLNWAVLNFKKLPQKFCGLEMEISQVGLFLACIGSMRTCIYCHETKEDHELVTPSRNGCKSCRNKKRRECRHPGLEYAEKHPNEFVADGDHYYGTIEKRDGTILHFLIDSEDLDRVRCKHWCAQNQGYVISGKKNFIILHRFLLNLPPGPEPMVDHINRNPLDNRKANLRVCTVQQNNFNIGVRRNNTSGYKGVSLVKRTGKWRAEYRYNQKKHIIGFFDTPEEASEAYQNTVRPLHGDFFCG